MYKKQMVIVSVHLLLLASTLVSVPANADEGMWTFHNPPTEALKSRYQFELQPEWLEKLRLSAATFGSSSSFVSPEGLILTNHHVALSCAQRLSSEKENLVELGFLARSHADERLCPGAEVRMLTSYAEVTADITAVVEGAAGEAAAKKRQEKIAAIESSCRTETKLRCDVVTLYRGGQYWLYRYKIFQDVRLVFAPEYKAGFFGGDNDNFVYPRFALDAAFVRAYENGKPVRPQHYLKFSKDGVKEGDLIFSAGNPGSTDRQLTNAELIDFRLQGYPIRLTNSEDRREALVNFGAQSAEAKRRASDPMFGLENGLKVLKGETKALAVERLYTRKKSEEESLKKQADVLIKKGEFKWANGDPWAVIEAAVKKQNAHAFEATATEYTRGTILAAANDIVAIAYESLLPEGERLRAYRDSALPQLKRAITSPRAWYADLETARLTQRIEEAMSYVGQEHPAVERMMQGATPADAALRLMSGTELTNAANRKALLDGGKKAVDESKDSLIVLARDLYPLWRKNRLYEQTEIAAPKQAAYDDIAKLKFKILSLNQYPDATGTLRLGFGKVAGYDRDGIATPWRTTFYGLYDRAEAFGHKPPFELAPKWLAAKNKINLSIPYNFVSTVDIIGGSSGSAVVNTKGELVGVLFDGNLEGLGNRFQYQERTARSLAVDVRGLVEALDSVYDARELKRELTSHW